MLSKVSSESDLASSSEGEVKEEEPAEESLEYESDSSYHAPPVGSEVTSLVLIEEEDEVRDGGVGSVQGLESLASQVAERVLEEEDENDNLVGCLSRY